jgi:predicted RNA-binding protein with PIN domain
LEIASPVILVDGYNVCGYWGKLKKDFMNGRQEIARQMLIDDLVSFSAVRGRHQRIELIITIKNTSFMIS